MSAKGVIGIIAGVVLLPVLVYFAFPNPGKKALRQEETALEDVTSWRIGTEISKNSRPIVSRMHAAICPDKEHIIEHAMMDFVRADGRVHPANDWPAVFADFRADPPTCHIFQGGLFLSQCFFAGIRKCEIDEHRQENDAGDNSDHALCTHDAPSSLAARPWAYFFCRLDLATRPAAVHYCGLNSSGGGGSMRMAVFQSVYVSTSRRSGVKTSRGNSSSAMHTTNSSRHPAGAGTLAIQSRHRSPFTKRFASLRTLPAIRITSSDWSRVSVPRGPAPQLAVRNLLSCVITQRDPSFL